jgi:4-amino-4-deoxy-L-arabinose transferase-like glycosyltransferase
MRKPRGHEDHSSVSQGQPSANKKRVKCDESETIMGESSFHLSLLYFANDIFHAIKQYWLLLFAIALGLTVRLLWLSAHSVLLDEATVAVGARDIIQNHTPMWDAMSNAPFVWMIGTILGKCGLANDFLLRLPSAIIGAASIVAVYWIARRMFDKRTAAASAILLALHPFAVAFSRVLFADPFQVFFILVGCYWFDRFATKPWREIPRKWILLVFLLIVWGIAFLMKYNAVVPGAIWLLSGVLSRRYKIIPTIAAFLAMAFGAFLTLLIWPYDESVWLLAFMGKAGSYNFVYALEYYVARLHLVFYGITEIMFVAAFVVAWLLRRKGGATDRTTSEQSSNNLRSSKAVLHLALFLLLQTAALILLGRMFERYLLVLVPFGCILLVALALLVIIEFARWTPHVWQIAFMQGTEQKLPPAKGKKILLYFAVVVAYYIFYFGASHSYSNYFKYLRNDVDFSGLANKVLTFEKQDQAGAAAPRRAFWLTPEPIAAYYLGYTQRYSRVNYPNMDGPTATQNFFEFASVPYSDDWRGDKVLAVRRLAHEWGLMRIVASPNHFMESAKHAADSAQRLELLPVENYLTSNFVHPNDLLIMQSGMIDLQGEPALEDISQEAGPPFISTLPLDKFAVSRVYRPEGFAPLTDTTLDRVRAGAWLLMRK